MAFGHPGQGQLAQIGKATTALAEGRVKGWWRVVNSGTPALLSGREAEQKRRLEAEGSSVDFPVKRDPAALPKFLSTFFGCVEIPPSGPHTHTLVYLHGRKFIGSYYLKQKHFFDGPFASCLRVVLPTAPLVGEQMLTEWFSEWPPTPRSLAPGRQKVADILAREVARLGEAGKVFLGGSSQGCILGLDTFLRSPHDLGGFFGLNGYWPKGSSEALTKLRPELLKQPVLLVNGERDTVVDPSSAKSSYEELRKAGLTPEILQVPKMSHHAGELEGKYIKHFLSQVLRP
ncbi:unnamed protein product [Symbiodinium microadriaticum]|nr:unnamed protein product [Symbiodinium microadriaticum]